MKLCFKKFEVSAGRPIIFINEEDALEKDIFAADRIEVSFKQKKIIGSVDVVQNFIKKGEIALTDDIVDYLNLKTGEFVEIKLVPRSESAVKIKKKMNGEKLSRQEIHLIIKDIVNNALTEAEVAEFIVAVYRNGMSRQEIIFLTEAMYKTGSVLKWNRKIVADKHCIGGVAANRTTPIVISICASAGITMPKTSSRAITSAAGTADVIETVAKINFPASELKRIVEKTGACLAWGGSLGISPADDKLIKIEKILKIDSEPQLLASILSKKLAVGSNLVLIDIPCGEGAKVSKAEALKLKKNFLFLGKKFRIKIKVILTDGSQPIGNGIGPILEMIDVLKVLERNNPPKDLEEKSVNLAAEILEMSGKAKQGKGDKMAWEILNSGKALKKFKEIIKAQGETKTTLKPAKYQYTINAEKSGKIKRLDNKKINGLANVLGCPADKGAGIYLYHHVGKKIKKGEKIMTLYAESEEKLKEGIEVFSKDGIIKIN